MPREIHDHYFHQAKSEGFRSRAAYKLIEIDEKRGLLRPGDAVLDAGAAPGSWLQVAARRVGPTGIVVGIDTNPIDPNFREDNIVVLQGDLTECPLDELRAPLREPHRSRSRPNPDKEKTPDPLFNVLLSDMAPHTTGDRTIDHHTSLRLCQSLLDRCGDLLATEGHLVMKVFEGEAYPDLLARARAMFGRVKGFRPKASRSDSTEIYLVARSFTGIVADPTTPRDEDDNPPIELPKRKPSAGWGA